jgi:aconitate hydratase
VDTITRHDLICAAVLSGNRNFEARIHPNIKANFLASPPLVVAFALAGTVRRDLQNEPIGVGALGRDIYLKDIWPSPQEVLALMPQAMDPDAFKQNYAHIQSDPGVLWQNIEGVTGQTYSWPDSTYIARPPFLDHFTQSLPQAPRAVQGARAIALFGDSITTDHISPAGAIKVDSPAGRWLSAHHVKPSEFNSYGSRRGNHEVMVRGTFANVRLQNLLIPVSASGARTEGGYTLYQPRGQKGFFDDAQSSYQDEGNPTHITTASSAPLAATPTHLNQGLADLPLSLFDAAMKYQAEGTPTLVFAGEEYGTGSSRDWAAKGTQLLGIVAVIARSFERIHRSNLIGMGVLALQFQPGDSWASLGIRGHEIFDLELGEDIQPRGQVMLVIRSEQAPPRRVPLILRIDTAIEVAYYRHGGILPFVLRDLLSGPASMQKQ